MSGKHVNVALFVVHKGCPHACSFCNQRSITGQQKDLTAEDIRSAAQTALASLDSETAAGGEIAFFGGSFTMIEKEYMLSLLETAYEYIRDGRFSGIRISTRPDGISEEICMILRKYGVTAVELGAQSLDDRVLEMNERGHTAYQVEKATKMLQSFGFETGLQMMTGLYGSEDEDCLETARKIIDLHPDTVRIYPTVVLKNTKLGELYERGEYNPPDAYESVPLCAELINMFTGAGIKIIRVGLHSGGGVDGEQIAGAYHPAFRELCESRIIRDALEKLLRKKPKGSYTIIVPPGCRSKATGQRRCNIEYFSRKGYELTIDSLQSAADGQAEKDKFYDIKSN